MSAALRSLSSRSLTGSFLEHPAPDASARTSGVLPRAVPTCWPLTPIWGLHGDVANRSPA